MKAFLREMVAAIKEGPRLYFVPLWAAVEAAKTPHGSTSEVISLAGIASRTASMTTPPTAVMSTLVPKP